MIGQQTLRPKWIWRACALLAGIAPSGNGDEPASVCSEVNPPEDLTEMGFEDPMNLQVTSVSKKSEEQALGNADCRHRYEDLRKRERRRPFLEVVPLPVHLAVPIVGDGNTESYTSFLPSIPTEVKRGAYGKIAWRF
ncbi:MAG: hypothetical protein IT365_02190 [Candidatus Hydrogenedentes bacterium]|nr:hypothetical protein [Candidatus Hydrogenedentota bacterium]